MQLKNTRNGFSILEVMIAVAVIGALGAGIYRLQLADLSATQQITVKQLMMQSATSLASQIYTNLNYCATNNTMRVSGCTATSGANNYTETAYTDNNSIGIDCSANSCSDSQFAQFLLYQWKSGFGNMPVSNVKGIVCRDTSMTIPTATNNGGCNGSGGLVIKMVWQSHIEAAESAAIGDNNFILLPLANR